MIKCDVMCLFPLTPKESILPPFAQKWLYSTTGFWSPLHRSFFDIRVFNPFASTYSRSKLKACHRRNELENAVSTMRESGQSNMDHSHLSFSLQLEGWGNLPLHFTNSLPHQFLTATLNLTQQSSPGSTAAYPSLF